jgi:hypothetical protein
MFRKIVILKIFNEKHMSLFKIRKLNMHPLKLLVKK